MPRDQVFVSYSHKDKKWLERLQVHLKPHVKKSGIVIWADTDIQPGSKWKDEIAAALARAKVAVLLVSPDFLASDFVVENELPELLDAAEREGLRILWIAVSASAVKQTDIAKYQAAHNPAIALDRRAKAALNKELVAICEKISDAAIDAAKPVAPAPPEKPRTLTTPTKPVVLPDDELPQAPTGPRPLFSEPRPVPPQPLATFLAQLFEDRSFGDTLRPGAQGTVVENLRTALDWLGYTQPEHWQDEPVFDEMMLTAMTRFQLRNGHINKDGLVGPGTRRLLVDVLKTNGFDFDQLKYVRPRRTRRGH